MKEDIEKAADAYCYDQPFGGPIEHLSAYDGFVAGAEFAKPKWISVKDRLPKENQGVLVWSKRAEQVQSAYLVNGNLVTIHDHLIGLDLEFSHWMPLPEPPDKEEAG